MGRFSHFDGSFSLSLAGLSRPCRAERGKREGVQRSCRFWNARREDNSMLVRRLDVRRAVRVKSFPHFPVDPFIFFSTALRGSVLHSNLRILLLAHPLSGVHALRILRAYASAVFRFLPSPLHPSAIKRCGTVRLG